MKVKNEIQNTKVGVTVLLPSAGRISPEIFGKMKDFAQASEDKKAEAKEALDKSLPKEIKKELEQLGCETPLDTVDVSLSLSSFLFDVYMTGVTVPAAPLARKIFEKKTLDLAEKLKNPKEFEFDGEFKDIVEAVMMDDKKWESVKIHIDVHVKGEKLSVPLIHKAANMFPNVLEAATKLFMELESAKSKPETAS